MPGGTARGGTGRTYGAGQGPAGWRRSEVAGGSWVSAGRYCSRLRGRVHMVGRRRLRPRVRCVSPMAPRAGSAHHAPPALPSSCALALAGDPAGGWWPSWEHATPRPGSVHTVCHEAPSLLGWRDPWLHEAGPPTDRVEVPSGREGARRRGGCGGFPSPFKLGAGAPRYRGSPGRSTWLCSETPHMDLVRGFHSFPPEGQADTLLARCHSGSRGPRRGRAQVRGQQQGRLWCPAPPSAPGTPAGWSLPSPHSRSR